MRQRRLIYSDFDTNLNDALIAAGLGSLERRWHSQKRYLVVAMKSEA
jgi:hypothetical protein